MAESGLRCEGKVTIVTGGAGGIGKGVVQRFARQGSNVVFCDIRDEDGSNLEESVNSEQIGKVKYIHCNVTSEDEVKNLVTQTLDLFGHIDCVICVAGTHPAQLTIDSLDTDSFFDLIKLNVLHPMLLSKFALPSLRKSKGNIITIASINATVGQRGAITYDTTKGAVLSFTKTLAIDESRNGVRVNSISPSIIDTPLTRAFLELSKSANAKSLFNSFSLLDRMGTVEEVANACLYLATEGTFCTGIDLKVTGGTELGFNRKV